MGKAVSQPVRASRSANFCTLPAGLRGNTKQNQANLLEEAPIHKRLGCKLLPVTYQGTENSHLLTSAYTRETALR